MYAIVDIAGQQFKVEKDNEIFVHRLEGNEGDNMEFNDVMLVEDGDNINVGKPFIEGAKVSAKIVSHLKGDKVMVFKKKRRKGYQVKNGHRQYLSKILIEGISLEA
ncbi:MAG: 50S ribosomal protein L21 [Bacteroidetes bacterium 4572_114]|nr:MAG: 50S ribosomal protein L21 [Bacteroidetes bacterium 4572_114]